MKPEPLKSYELLAMRVIWSGLGLWCLGGAFLSLWAFGKLAAWILEEFTPITWIIEITKGLACG